MPTPRVKSLGISVAREEYESLRDAAAKAGKTLSTFCRDVLLAALSEKTFSNEIERVERERMPSTQSRPVTENLAENMGKDAEIWLDDRAA